MAKLNVEMQRRIVTNMYNVLMTASRLRETSWNGILTKESIFISFPHALSCSPRQEALREDIDSWHQVPALSGEGEWGIVALSFLSASQFCGPSLSIETCSYWSL